MDKIFIKKRLIGVQDIGFDESGLNEQIEFTGTNGEQKTATKINASHIPLSKSARDQNNGAKNIEEALNNLKAVQDKETNALTYFARLDIKITDSVDSIQAMIDSIPKNLGGFGLTVVFPDFTDSNGFQLSKAIKFQGFYNGELWLQGGTQSQIEDQSNIENLFVFNNCDALIEVRYLTFKHPESLYALHFVFCPRVRVRECTFSGNGRTTIAANFYCSNGVLENCIFDGDYVSSSQNTTGSGYGRNLFDIFYSLSSRVPYGAMDLSYGTLITNCKTLYPDFYNECIVRKNNNEIRVLTESEWQHEAATNGSCGAFVVDEINGSVRLPKITGYLRNGENLGTYLNDAIRNIYAGISFRTTGNTVIECDGAFNAAATGQLSKVTTSDIVDGENGAWKAQFYASNVVPTAEENRPKTVLAKLYIQVYSSTIPMSLEKRDEYVKNLTEVSLQYETVRQIAEKAESKISGFRNDIYQTLLYRSPVGAFLWWTGPRETIPYGYLVCDGTAISRTDYSDLYNVIGTLWGSGDGVTTFNLPDLYTYSRFIRSAGINVVTGAYQNQMIASHSHAFTGRTIRFTATSDQVSGGYPAVGLDHGTFDIGGNLSSLPANTEVGSENRPVNIAFYPLIRYSKEVVNV